MGLKDWLISRNQARLNSLNKNVLDTEFEIQYGFRLKNICNKEELEKVKALYKEVMEVELKYGEGATVPSPLEEKKLIRQRLFLDNIEEIVKTGKLEEALSSLAQEFQKIEGRGGEKKMGVFGGFKDWLNQPLQGRINQSILELIYARKRFFKENSEFLLNFNTSHAVRFKLLDKAIKEINNAFYMQLNIHRLDPNFKTIVDSLENFKNKMVLSENLLYEYMEQGITFSENKKKQLFQLEKEFAELGDGERLSRLEAIETKLELEKQAEEEKALQDLKAREAYYQHVEEIDKEMTELVEDTYKRVEEIKEFRRSQQSRDER